MTAPAAGAGPASRSEAITYLAVGPLPGGAVADSALGSVLLRSGLGDARQILRIHTPRPTAAFTRRDSLRAGFDSAVTVARGWGFTPVIRGPGGMLAAYHKGSVVIDHVVRDASYGDGVTDRFRQFAELHASVLSGLGADVRIGRLPGEYCPGDFSLHVPGLGKVAGSAQRVTREGWLFSTVIQVTGAAALRAVLVKSYRELEYELDASTVAALDQAAPGISVDAVIERLAEAYSCGQPLGLAALPPGTLATVAEVASADERDMARRGDGQPSLRPSGSSDLPSAVG